MGLTRFIQVKCDFHHDILEKKHAFVTVFLEVAFRIRLAQNSEGARLNGHGASGGEKNSN